MSTRNAWRLLCKAVSKAKVLPLQMIRMVGAVQRDGDLDDLTGMVIAEFGADRLDIDVLIAIEFRWMALSWSVLPTTTNKGQAEIGLDTVMASAVARLEMPTLSGSDPVRFDMRQLRMWEARYGPMIERVQAERALKAGAIWA